MNWKYYFKYIDCKTNVRSDVTPLFENPLAFSKLIKDMIKPFKNEKIDKIVALDALGFLIGAPVALKLKKPLVLIRKEGKLPGEKSRFIQESFVDYGQTKKTFEIKKSSISKGDKILIIDEWIETGAQIKAVIGMIEALGGKVIGISVINADMNDNTGVLFEKYNLNAIHVDRK
jgi:adenine phosphoribosyltransferase